MTNNINYQCEDGIATLTFNNPSQKNALTPPMFKEMKQLLLDIAMDPECRVLIVTGEGDTFCSGANMRQFGKGVPDDLIAAKWEEHPVWNDPELRAQRIRRNGELTTTIHTMGKPTIAMIRGAAAGAGMSIALACDFRFACINARFKTAFSQIGASGDLGICYYLTKIVGPTHARELMFLSDTLHAEDAKTIGLVSRVSAEDALLGDTLDFARRLAAGPAIAYRLIKQNFCIAEAALTREYLDIEAQNMARTFGTQDMKEAVAAFLEKRPASFRGW